MSKKSLQNKLFPDNPSNQWEEKLAQVAYRFNQEYRNQPFELPTEVQEMPIYQEWIAGTLPGKITSPFWEIAQPKKNQHCLDIGCGASFLIYPWRDWQAFFHGQDVSIVAYETLKSRGSQLNSKLFKGVELSPAHTLNYPSDSFDLVIATGFSCYFPIDYWKAVLLEAKRVLKPDGYFVFDVLNPEQPLAEDWAVLETYLGAEVFLEPLSEWEKMIKAVDAKVISQKSGELFQLYKIKFI